MSLFIEEAGRVQPARCENRWHSSRHERPDESQPSVTSPGYQPQSRWRGRAQAHEGEPILGADATEH